LAHSGSSSPFNGFAINGSWLLPFAFLVLPKNWENWQVTQPRCISVSRSHSSGGNAVSAFHSWDTYTHTESFPAFPLFSVTSRLTFGGMAATARQFLIEFTLRVLRYGSDCVCGVLHL